MLAAHEVAVSPFHERAQAFLRILRSHEPEDLGKKVLRGRLGALSLGLSGGRYGGLHT